LNNRFKRTKKKARSLLSTGMQVC